jgi:predicted dehydrogenase
MESGKHVYTAVPAAWTLEQCDALVDAAKRTGQLYMNGETSYFRAEAAFCRRKHAEGAFGHITYIEAEYLHDMDHGLYEVAKNRLGDSFTRFTQGGVPMSYPTHSTSFAISLTGAHMTEVSCQGYTMPGDDWFRVDTQDGNTFGNEIGLFRMSNGAVARICEFRRVGHPGCERCRVYGTEGSFEWDLLGCAWATKGGFERVEPPLLHEPLPEELEAFTTDGHGGAEVYLMNEFVQSIVQGRLPRINAWEAVRYFAPGIVAHESAVKGGELLKIPDWGDAPG